MAGGRAAKARAIALVVAFSVGASVQLFFSIQTALFVIPPTVQFHIAVVGDEGVTIDVAFAQPFRPLRDFKAQAQHNNATIATIGSLPGPGGPELSFADRDGDGILSPGDRFTVGRVRSGFFEIVLFVSTNAVGRGSWVLSAPQVGFGSPTLRDYETLLDVTTAPGPRPLAQYSVVYLNNQYPLETVSPLRPGRTSYLKFDDMDADGRLSAGDRFTGDLVMSGLYDLVILWGDERVANVSWQRPPPSVTFSADQIAYGVFWFNVTVSNPPLRLLDFSASILEYGNWRDQIDSFATGSSRNGMMRFENTDGDGNLTAGDRIVVNVPFSGGWEMYVFWRYGQPVAHLLF